VPVASQLPLYRELVGDGERGLLFPPGDAFTLAGQVQRLIAEPGLRVDLLKGAKGAVRDWDVVVDQVEETHRRVCARRRDPAGKPTVRRRLANRSSIHVDLHMHTDHSPDCATPVDVLLDTAKERGLGAIAMAVTPWGASSAAQRSGSTFCDILTACAIGFPPPPIMSFSVTSTMRPRLAAIIASAACFAVVMRDMSPCRKIASAFFISACQRKPYRPISGSSPATLSTTMSRRLWERMMRRNSACTSFSRV